VRVIVDDVQHSPQLSPEALGRFKDLTGVDALRLDTDPPSIRYPLPLAPALLFALCGGENAVGMPAEAWVEAFVHLPGDEVAAFVTRAILRAAPEPRKELN
jgi:hypothetical protein